MTTDNRPTYYVYIMSNLAGIMYVGITNNLIRRVQEHKTGVFPGFSKKHNTHRLVYYEEHKYVNNAIYREKQIKTWRRKKKKDLITFLNPRWEDLAADWYEGVSSPARALVELSL